MPTLEELSTLLADRAERFAPDPDAVLAVFERPTLARRRRGAPLLAAAAIVALGVGSASVAGSFDGTQHTPAGGDVAALTPTRPAWQFTIGDLPGWTSARDNSSWTTDSTATAGGWQQGAILTSQTGRGRVDYIYEPSLDNLRYPGDVIRAAGNKAEPVMVNGRPSLFLAAPYVVTEHRGRGATVTISSSEPELVWTNSDGSWSKLDGQFPAIDNAVAERELLQIASAINVEPAGPTITMPFHVALGDQYLPDRTLTLDRTSCVSWTTADSPLVDGQPRTEATVCRVPAKALSDIKALGPMGSKHGVRPSAIRRDLGDGSVMLIDANRKQLSVDQQRTILANADVSPSLNDQGTWLPVTP